MSRSELKFTVQGEQRKQMAQIISELIEKPVVYKKTPTYAYEIGGFSISKDGVLSWGEDIDEDTISGVVAGLQMLGFTAAQPVRTISLVQTTNVSEDVQAGDAPDMPDAANTPEETNPNKLTVEIPRRLMNEAAFANLDRLIEGKGRLIRKSIEADNLEYKAEGKKVMFPWFTLTGDADEAFAYTQFISKLVEQARTCKKVLMKEKVVENEKYAFRCFLLRLGFIGDEYKAARRVLLKNLTGDGAWKKGAPG